MKKLFHFIQILLLSFFITLLFVSCNFSSSQPEIVSIYVSQLPTKMNYAYEEPLDLSGLVVNAKYSDGSEKEVDSWISMPKPWTKLKSSGSVSVTITYEEKITNFSVIVASEGEEVPTDKKENIYATGATAASVISALSKDGDNLVHITGTVTEEDFENINAAIKSINVGVSLDFSGANFTKIPQNAFKDCKRLTGIVIPACVTSIGHYAFNGCTGLKTLELEDGEEELTLGYNKYDGYSSGGWEGRGLFRDCPLESLYLGRNIEYSDYNDKSPEAPCHYYGYSAFALIQSSNFSVEIGSKVTSIQAYSFAGCESLSSVKIDSDAQIDSIGKYAFESCKNLTDFKIFSTVKKIGNGAFYGCTKLKTLTIPASVASIGNYAFNGCTGLKTLELEDGEEVLTLGYNKYDEYSSGGWEGRGLFRDCPLESLYLGRNIEYADYNDKSPEAPCHYYGWSAFANIESANLSVEIGSKVTSIQVNSFSGCESLSSVKIDSGAQIDSIGKYAFEICKNLTEFEIPCMVKKIGNGAFYGCTKLKTLTVPASVASIGNFAFNGCTGLSMLRLEDGEETLTLGYNKYDEYSSGGWEGRGLFRDCPLESLYLGRNIEYADYNDKSPDASYHYYGYSAFANISTLTTVNINVPTGVNSVTIGKYAFKGCTGINNATFTTPEGESWTWFKSSLGSITSSGTTVDVSTTTAAASVLKNLGESYLHGKKQ